MTKRGTIVTADRLQRLVAAVLLILLNVVGIWRAPDSLKWLALAVQLELLITGLIGWCPFYWALGASAARLSTVSDDPPAGPERQA